jgi:trans-aconitate 2-methyltransferase
MAWDPEQYLRFKEERFAPFEDLLTLVQVREGLRAVDLGCGTGELTLRLAHNLPASDVLGLDTSETMLAEASALARPGLRFERRAIEDLDGQWDLICSNAAIHWVDNHAALIPRLFSRLSPGGQLVLQFPSNHDHPANRMVPETAAEEPFRTLLGGWTRRPSVLPLPAYGELLHDCGARGFTLFEKVYPHLLPDADALAQWLSGTTLVPYLERLDPPRRPELTEALRKNLNRCWPEGPIFFGFRRILLAASRGGEG